MPSIEKACWLCKQGFSAESDIKLSPYPEKGDVYYIHYQCDTAKTDPSLPVVTLEPVAEPLPVEAAPV